jgi:hypothetical protein
VPTWAATTTLSNISGTLAVGSGGTNATSLGNHMLLAFNGTSIVATSTPTAGAYLATSTTATTTLQGMLAVGSNALNVLSNGNVGLGTAAPAAAVDLAKTTSGADTTKLRISGGNSLSNYYLDTVENFYDSTNGHIRWTLLSHAFADGDKSLLTLDSKGNVGIGTTSPGALLDLAGSLRQLSNPSLTVAPTGNSPATLSTLSVQGTTAASNQREFLANFGLNSNTGSAATYGSGNGDKVAIYGGIDATSGTGAVWALNTVTTLESGSGTVNAHGYELDFNNLSYDWNGDFSTSTVGLSITGAGNKRSMTAMLISGPAAQIWNYGFLIAGNSVKDKTFYDLGIATTSIYVGGTHTYDAIFNGGGNVGIGTTTPNKNLTVSGAGVRRFGLDSADNIAVFNLMYNGGIKWEIYNDGSGGRLYVLDSDDSNGVYMDQNVSGWTNYSDIRLKDNIENYSVLDRLSDFRAVSFDWKTGGTHDVGVIAQEIVHAFPELVDVGTSGDLDPAHPLTGAWGVHYDRMSALALEGVKELNLKLEDLASTSSAQAQDTSFTGRFFSSLFTRLTEWLSDTTNGITDFFAHHLHSDDLCLKKSDGTEACLTGDQLAAMAAGSAAAGAPYAGKDTEAPAATPASEVGSDAGNAPTTTLSDNAPPKITINGANPARINVGDTYADLGATITGPQQDLNLGIHLYIDGAPMDAVQLDTSTAGTHKIDYVATDAAGLAATSTRTVIVSAPANDNHATSTPTVATSTAPITPVANDNPPPFASTGTTTTAQ